MKKDYFSPEFEFHKLTIKDSLLNPSDSTNIGEGGQTGNDPGNPDGGDFG